MSLRQFITNSYMEGIDLSFLGTETDEGYYQLLESTVKKELGTHSLEVLKVECGVGLAILGRVDQGSLVHLKVIKGTEALGHQTECCRVQKYLAGQGFPCTVPIGLPVTFAGSSLQLEEHQGAGEYRDSHLPQVMGLQAEHLAWLHELLKGYRSDTAGQISPKFIPRDRVWQNPPQEVFRFDKHDSGDEPIQEKARAAKAIFEEPHGRQPILSHEDWSNKHFRFQDNRVSVIYDWDSLTRIDELHTVGLACSTFTATWYYPTRIFPTREESQSFVEAYSRFSGRAFTADEKRIISSYAAYTLAYIARCTFALNNGTIRGNAVEQPFQDITDGVYF